MKLIKKTLNLINYNLNFISRIQDFKIGLSFLIFLSLILSFILSLPLLYLLFKLTFGINLFIDFIFNFKIFKLAMNTMLLVILVVFFAILISLPLAFLNVRSNLPFAKHLTSISVLPIALPSYVMATTQIELWGPRGLVYEFLNKIFGVDKIPSFYGLSGSVFVLSLITYPYIYIGLCAMFRRFDYQMIDASKTLGSSNFQTFRKIIFPLVKPTVASGSLLVALYVLSDFGAISLLRFNTFTTAIFNRMYTSIGNYGVLEISTLAIFFCFFILFLESRTRNNARHFSNSSNIKIKKADLGFWRWILFPIVLMPPVLGFLLPVSVLIYWLIQGILNDNSFTNIISSTINTISISLLSSLIITIFSIPIILVIRKKIKFLSAIIEKSCYIGLSLPGIVVGMSLVFFSINYFDMIYQTYIILVLAYLISFLPAVITPIRSTLTQIDPKLEEASYTLGKGKISTFYNIIVKLSTPGFIYGAILVFILCLKELPATLILSPVGFRTLSTSIWASASEAFFMDTAAASLILVIIAGIPSYLFMSNDLSRKVTL